MIARASDGRSMTDAWRALAGAFDIACEREIALRPDIKSFHSSVAAQRRKPSARRGTTLS